MIFSLCIGMSRPATNHGNARKQAKGPASYRGRSQVTGTGDTCLDVRSLHKGAVWINGHAVGRYWDIGPQDTLYVPGPWLHKRWNQIVVFDMEGVAAPRLAGRTAPILDGPARQSDE